MSARVVRSPSQRPEHHAGRNEADYAAFSIDLADSVTGITKFVGQLIHIEATD